MGGVAQLAEVFEADIDGIMRSLGYCCGRKHIFSPQVLCCYGKQLCAIPRDTVYYNYQNRFVFFHFFVFFCLQIVYYYSYSSNNQTVHLIAKMVHIFSFGCKLCGCLCTLVQKQL